MTAPSELLDALMPVVDAFNKLGAAYYVGGSVASGAFGEFRATNDVDVVADLKAGHAQLLVDALGAAYYADVESINDAVRRRASFNLIHFDTMLKIDIFVLRPRTYDQEALRRRMRRRMSTAADAPEVDFASPEDVILAKLDWFKQGGGVSDRQWRDVQGVLRVQSTALDFVYMRHWAAVLAVDDLLGRALTQAGAG